MGGAGALAKCIEGRHRDLTLEEMRESLFMCTACKQMGLRGLPVSCSAQSYV